MDATTFLSFINMEDVPVIVMTVDGDRVVEARVTNIGWLAAVLDLAHVDLKIDGNGRSHKPEGSHRRRR